jgi:hypothetical protein
MRSYRRLNHLPSSQSGPTSTSEMRRDSAGNRKALGVASDDRAMPDLLSPEGLAHQMTVDDCIQNAERECLNPPCDYVVDCDFASECLADVLP